MADSLSEMGFVPPGFGWIDDPAAVSRTMAQMAAEQGVPATYAARCAALDAAPDDDEDVVFWDFEKRLFGKILNSWNQGQIGTCFPPGTRVRMADGSHKTIEQVRLNDTVLTAEGNTGRVTHLWVRREQECLVRIRCHGHYGIAATAEHPVLTKRGYVRMDRLRIGDLVAVPKYAPETSRHVLTAEHRNYKVALKGDRARKVVYNGAAQFGRKTVVAQVAPVPDTLELTPALGRLMGLFLAEGSADGNKVVWTFSAAEKDTLAAEAVTLIRECLGAEATVQSRGGSKTCRVNLHGRAWCELFQSLCGNGAGLKRMHPDLTSGPLEFLEAVYDGWVAGDGHVHGDGTVQGTTVSHDLALNMFDIANRLGRTPAIRHCDPKPSHGVKTRRRRYDVVCGNGTGRNLPPQDDKVQWRKVTSIVLESYSGDVFNMEVEGDNSYVAEGIGVHNCVSFGWARGITDLIVLMTARGAIEWPGAVVATEPIYGGSRVEVGRGACGREDGSCGAWAAKYAHDWGTLLRKPYAVGQHSYDLSRYSVERSREWGMKGVPDDLEPTAKLYPVKSVAMATTFEQAWKLIGSGRPIPVCSDVGYDSPLVEGFCARRGSWGHCMLYRGRVKAYRAGRLVRALACQNSWGDYLRGRGEAAYVARDKTKRPLPPGCFLVEEPDADRMLRQQDSFAIDDQGGFAPRRVLDWIP